jgi:hypothetical protein
MAVPFAVLNSSARTVEVLPPQIQLAGTSKEKHRKAIKAEPVAIKGLLDNVTETRAWR